MAKRRRIIEGTWTCSSCGTAGIKGRHKVCPACGSPREGEEMAFDFGERAASGGSTAASVTDQETLDLAEAGADWMCLSCEAGNRGDVSVCRQCGTPRGQTAAPAPEPAPTPTSAVPLAAAGVGAGTLLLGGGVGSVLCCGVLWLAWPVTSEAVVSQRTFVRESTVERLVEVPKRGWKDTLPAPASPPGSPTLAPGLGEIQACTTHACYPRPPEGGRLVSVTGRQWRRTHTVTPMEEHTREGWEDSVPPESGRWPSGGSGGQTGRIGSARCQERERTPERCRTESRREACGTEERCTVRDLGNGFAEEVCEDVTKYCSVDQEVCDPAVYDDWCSWSELSWGTARQQTTSGTLERPRWPSLRPGAREQLSAEQDNTVTCTTLAGTGSGSFSVSGDDLMGFDVGAQYFLSDRTGPQRVPERLVRAGAGPFRDCGADIPADTLVDREECRYTAWEWSAERPLYTRGETLPDWPAVKLRDDGVEKRREWAELTLGWERRGSAYSEDFTVSVAEGQRWPPGRGVPVKVLYSGELSGPPSDWPDEGTAP